MHLSRLNYYCKVVIYYQAKYCCLCRELHTRNLHQGMPPSCPWGSRDVGHGQETWICICKTVAGEYVPWRPCQTFNNRRGYRPFRTGHHGRSFVLVCWRSRHHIYPPHLGSLDIGLNRLVASWGESQRYRDTREHEDFEAVLPLIYMVVQVTQPWSTPSAVYTS
jgi:hypothetical protein